MEYTQVDMIYVIGVSMKMVSIALVCCNFNGKIWGKFWQKPLHFQHFGAPKL